MSRRGIGRGLAAIIPETAAEAPELRDLPLELIRPNPEQPRTRFDPDFSVVLNTPPPVAPISAS